MNNLDQANPTTGEDDGLNEPIHCLICCVNYADYFEHTLPRLLCRRLNVSVVTTPEDRATRDLCDSHKVRAILSTRVHQNGADFNKGALINDIYRETNPRGWTLLLDADVILLGELDTRSLDPSVIYGVVRHNVYETWEMWEQHAGDTHENEVDIMMEKINRSGVPTSLERFYSSMPAYGYFQLFWVDPDDHPYDLYSEISRGAEWSDEVFRDNWPVDKRQFLRMLRCVHLGPSSTNWHGRKSKPWGTPQR